MMTIRENYMALVNNNKPERLVNQYEPFSFILNDPLFLQQFGPREEGKDIIDAWGVTQKWPAGEHAAVPYNPAGHRVCPDVLDWKNYVKAPSVQFSDEAWAPALEAAAKVDRNEYMLTGLIVTGIFEQSHFLLGMDETLVNLLMEPEAMKELFDYITDYKIAYAKELIDHIHPDAILSHDDWGSNNSLLMSPEVFRELLKPCYEKFYGYIRSRGVQVIHHSDSYCVPIVEDMVELGITAWQGALVTNDIPALQKQLDGRMILMGGLNALKFDVHNWTEKLIREEVDRSVEASKDLPGFIPCITYGLPESIYPGVLEVITDEIKVLNEKYYGIPYVK